MSYGVLQEYFSSSFPLAGNPSLTGIIGTTSNGVMYLSMPFLFALFTRGRLARHRQAAALVGSVVACLSFLLSSFSTDVWHLVATQGVLAALGCALVYSPTTLSLGEWYNTGNRAVAYGLVLSCKNVVGSACPFLMRALLDRYGFRVALRVWTAVALASSVSAIFLVPTPPSTITSLAPHASTSDLDGGHERRRIPWHFLRRRTFYIYMVAIVLQSAGYGIPQTYLNTYAHEVTLLSQTSATLLLTLFNIPGIASSSFFGYLSNSSSSENSSNINHNKRRWLPSSSSVSATTATSISALCSAISAFLFWGLTYQGSMALLIVFSITFGFFAGGYSATWGGIINELEHEAAMRNEAIDTGMVYGLLNGARGVGYVSGGLVSVPLLGLKMQAQGRFGYGTEYGPLILFTGLASVFGGWGLVWKWVR
ncbi:major facilitator superfamily domain-containing protein [Bombardia bombarda]|uniref:Major facilitator superfamily domain-containing protein n=1 Tax=Bombardia bombarda TaxID=252184 RepID=A0AA40C9B9_9PEZI|nr:major facilitator superfamily domain-containing protein [Bombardia bombarda]